MQIQNLIAELSFGRLVNRENYIYHMKQKYTIKFKYRNKKRKM